MRIIEQQTYIQPDGTRIVLRRLDTPYYSPFSCERLVEDKRQEGLYGCEMAWVRKVMKGWEKFEQKIGSVKE